MTSPDFDLDRWKRINDHLDKVLDLDDKHAQLNYLRDLRQQAPELLDDVLALYKRSQNTDTTPTFLAPPKTVEPPSQPNQTAPVDDGFGHLLQRALRAERATQRSARYNGELCGAWRLREIIGVGGMGEVWLAERADGLYSADAAVKFLRNDIDAYRFEARFTQERQLLARLNHPGIARLLDAGRQFGQSFLVLEYVRGKPLLEYLSQYAPGLEERLALLCEIGEAVAYAHSQLIVHRDLKPSNVLVTEEGRIKLLDFGVAGLVESAERQMGGVTQLSGQGLTLEYAAPEQIRGENVGVASDIYSFGALCFHVLAGRRAHVPAQPGRAALEFAILHTTPPRMSEVALPDKRQTATVVLSDQIAPCTHPERLRGDLDAIVARAMRREPSERYRSIEAMVDDLKRWQARRPIAARREDRSYRARLWLRRNWFAASLISGLLLSLCAGLATTLWQFDRARAEANRANRTADYLVELLNRADPDLHSGNWPSALEMLDMAAQDSHLRFKDEPETEEKLARLFATTYRALSRDSDAQPLAARSVELSTQLHGADALPTLRARSLLAWIRYWGNEPHLAIEDMDRVMPLLRKALPTDGTEILDHELQYANILAGVYRLPESIRLFESIIDRWRTYPQPLPDLSWRIADAEGDLAAAYTRAARWKDALQLWQRNRKHYENPPANNLKTGLTHLGNLISTQNIVGDPTGVESQLRELIERWRKLAGESNERIAELLNDLGVYYIQQSDGVKAMSVYQEIKDRIERFDYGNASDRLRIDLDLIEVKNRFNLQPNDTLITELEQVTAAISKEIAPEYQRYRQFLLRSAVVALSADHVDLAERLWQEARTNARDKSVANAIRERFVEMHIARQRGQQDVALNIQRERVQQAQRSSGQSPLRNAYLYIDYAYQLYLSDQARPEQGLREEALRHLDRVSHLLGKSLPDDHRVYKQRDYVAALWRYGADSDEVTRTRGALATTFGRTAQTLPAVLSGAYVSP